METKTTTGVGKTEVTLGGAVDPNGAETKYYFEYATSEAELLLGIGKKTAEASAGAGTKSVEESKSVTGLTEGTRYVFQIVATNGNGTADGAEEVFLTAPMPEFTKKTGFVGDAGSALFEPSPGGARFTYGGGIVISSGEMPSKSTVANVDVAFRYGDIGCNTSSEELAWRAVKGRLGYINKAKKEVGLLLGEPFNRVLADCKWMGAKEGQTGEYQGAAIAAVPPFLQYQYCCRPCGSSASSVGVTGVRL